MDKFKILSGRLNAKDYQDINSNTIFNWYFNQRLHKFGYVHTIWGSCYLLLTHGESLELSLLECPKQVIFDLIYKNRY